jgi:hypothetical protein
MPYSRCHQRILEPSDIIPHNFWFIEKFQRSVAESSLHQCKKTRGLIGADRYLQNLQRSPWISLQGVVIILLDNWQKPGYDRPSHSLSALNRGHFLWISQFALDSREHPLISFICHVKTILAGGPLIAREFRFREPFAFSDHRSNGWFTDLWARTIDVCRTGSVAEKPRRNCIGSLRAVFLISSTAPTSFEGGCIQSWIEFPDGIILLLSCISSEINPKEIKMPVPLLYLRF